MCLRLVGTVLFVANRQTLRSRRCVLWSIRTELHFWLGRLHLHHTIFRFRLAILKRVSLDTSDRIVEHAVVRLEEKFHVKSQAVQAVLLVNVADRSDILTPDSRLAKHERLDALQ